jgi:hypothetical protein
MLQRTLTTRVAHRHNQIHKIRPHHHKYKLLNRWQREATGLSRWDSNQSHRSGPRLRRFNPENTTLTKGTSPDAYKWWWYHQQHLPATKPENFETPLPVGRRAWPAAWTDEFAAEILALSPVELKRHLMEKLTDVIFEETQNDGYELRQIDFEGRPTTALPDKSLIENFLLEEDTIRERVIQQVVEDEFGLTPTSKQRAEIRDVPNLIRYVTARILRCRAPRKADATAAVADHIAAQPVQPVLGFVHALPQDGRSKQVIAWERLFHHDHQFGNAIYRPRSGEKARGNVQWAQLAAREAERRVHQVGVQDGSLLAAHKDMLRRAAE